MFAERTTTDQRNIPTTISAISIPLVPALPRRGLVSRAAAVGGASSKLVLRGRAVQTGVGRVRTPARQSSSERHLRRPSVLARPCSSGTHSRICHCHPVARRTQVDQQRLPQLRQDERSHNSFACFAASRHVTIRLIHFLARPSTATK